MQDNPRKRKSSLPSPRPSGPEHQNELNTWPTNGRKTPDGQLNSQHSQTSSSGKKRKRNAQEDASERPHAPARKRSKAEADTGSPQSRNLPKEDAEKRDPIQWWARTGNWPNDFGEMNGSESDASKKKQRSDLTSYASRVRVARALAAHARAYEEQLRRHGIMPLTRKGTSGHVPTAESKDMCNALMNLDGLPPAYNSCSDEKFVDVFERATICHEERIRRDLTPHIVPSAELLCCLDGDTSLENVREEMSVSWTKCSPLGGTQPRPDFAYGLSSATFTKGELCKLENYANVNTPTKFTESMYFPFLVCEAKCGMKNINHADRQNVHSASIAVNAIVQLCRAGGADGAQDLSGHILVFSISHDNERAKVFGHFPIFEDGHPKFCRHHIVESAFTVDSQRIQTSNFTRAVYSKFYPQHLNRIKQAIARLPEPQTTSSIFDLDSDVVVDGDEAQGSEQDSQEPSVHRARSGGTQGERALTLMKQQMARMNEDHRKQIEQLSTDHRKQMEQQMEQQNQQMEQLNQVIQALLKNQGQSS